MPTLLSYAIPLAAGVTALGLVMLGTPPSSAGLAAVDSLRSSADAVLARPDIDPTLDPAAIETLATRLSTAEAALNLPTDFRVQQLREKAARVRAIRGGAGPGPGPGPLPSVEALRTQAGLLIAAANTDPNLVDPATLDVLADQIRPLDPATAAALDAKANEVRLKRGLPPIGVPAPTEPLPAQLPFDMTSQLLVLLGPGSPNPDVVDDLANRIQIRFPGGFATQVQQLRARARELRAAELQATRLERRRGRLPPFPAAIAGRRYGYGEGLPRVGQAEEMMSPFGDGQGDRDRDHDRDRWRRRWFSRPVAVPFPVPFLVTPPPPPASSAVPAVCVAPNGCALRAEPNASSPVIATFPSGVPMSARRSLPGPKVDPNAPGYGGWSLVSVVGASGVVDGWTPSEWLRAAPPVNPMYSAL